MVFINSKAVLLLVAGVFFSAASAAEEGPPVALRGEQCSGTWLSKWPTLQCEAGYICQEQNQYLSICVPISTTTSAPSKSTDAPVFKPTHVAVENLTTSNQSPDAASKIKYLMVFGDSYTSIGYFDGAAKPPLMVPLPGATTSGGLNWVGFVVSELNTSVIYAYDYAVYGATTDNSIVQGEEDFRSQSARFQKYLGHEGANASTIPWNENNTMAVVWLGINDVGNPFIDGKESPYDAVLDTYFDRLQKLYNTGIRYFTLFTVPPFDRVPVFAVPGTGRNNYTDIPALRASIDTFNKRLSTRFAFFMSKNHGVTGTIFNTSDSFNTPLDNPAAYGAQNNTCFNSDGKTCLWWDNYHPGQAIQKLLAQNFYETLTGVFF